MKNNIEKLLSNQWVELLVRWFIGIVFVYASYHKIAEPARFAKIIYGYDLFPYFSINLIAIILPFIEFYTGMALALGIYPRSAVLIINGMLLAFIIALGINLVRGHEFDCGCISFGDPGHFSSTGQLLIRDIIMFVMGLYVFFFDNPRKLSIINSFNYRRIIMRKKQVTSLLFAVCIFLILPAYAGHASEQDKTATAPVAVAREAVFEFDPVIEGTVIEHEYFIENIGNASLSIERVRASCGCTTVDYTKTIQPGTYGKITINGNTSGYGGRIFSKPVTVYTNDPKNRHIQLRITGKVEKFAVIAPQKVILRGQAGNKIQSVVSITPERKYPFNIVESYSDDLGKNAEFKLEKKDGKYFCFVQNLAEAPGNYRGRIHLKTDSSVKPEIIIKVYGMISENKS
ncbi:MAG: DUF1573 domain-containing protein [Desulfobacterales bacterium]|nr:DUF1573 domain-containing protein [Desulfobacterales bacterium]